jgi:hypothetical protein
MTVDLFLMKCISRVLGGADCMMHAEGSSTVAICLPIFMLKLSCRISMVWLNSGKETMCKLHPRAPVKVSTFWSRTFHVWSTGRPSFSSKCLFNHQPRWQPCTIRPLLLERMLCMRGINRVSPQNSGSIVRRMSGSCPNRSSLECMTGLVA